MQAREAARYLGHVREAAVHACALSGVWTWYVGVKGVIVLLCEAGRAVVGCACPVASEVVDTVSVWGVVFVQALCARLRGVGGACRGAGM